MEQTYYTPTEVATRLRVHLETVRRMIRRGELRAIKVGKEWRITATDLDAFLTRQANVAE